MRLLVSPCLCLEVLESIGTPLPKIPTFPFHPQRETSSASTDTMSFSSLPSAPFLTHSDHRRTAVDPGCPVRLNKFVRRLHDMLLVEKDSGVVEWRRGLLVLYSTDAFSKRILPKYFNTRNFKTFRRQLNYYGFVHVRSFSATGNTTTALWINQAMAEDDGNNDISAVLKLRRVEPSETAKRGETPTQGAGPPYRGRRYRLELQDAPIGSDPVHGHEGRLRNR
jgi:HSF-type DNA-binding